MIIVGYRLFYVLSKKQNIEKFPLSDTYVCQIRSEKSELAALRKSLRERQRERGITHACSQLALYSSPFLLCTKTTKRKLQTCGECIFIFLLAVFV